MLNMTTRGDAKKSFLSFDTLRGVWLNKVRKQAIGGLITDYRRAAELISQTDGSQMATTQAVVDAVIAGQPAWAAFYKRTYMGVGMDFAQHVSDGLTAAFLKAMVDKGVEQDKWAGAISRYIELQAGEKIAWASNTTIRGITAVLAEGWAEGEGADDLGKRVSRAAGFTIGRGTVIARTEVISSSNLGSHTAAKTFQVPLIKTWRVTQDGRERADHASADGQIRQLDDPYDVGGSQLLFPGDGSLGATAEQVIQCRCVSLYSPA